MTGVDVGHHLTGADGALLCTDFSIHLRRVFGVLLSLLELVQNAVHV